MDNKELEKKVQIFTTHICLMPTSQQYSIYLQYCRLNDGQILNCNIHTMEELDNVMRLNGITTFKDFDSVDKLRFHFRETFFKYENGKLYSDNDLNGLLNNCFEYYKFILENKALFKDFLN